MCFTNFTNLLSLYYHLYVIGYTHCCCRKNLSLAEYCGCMVTIGYCIMYFHFLIINFDQKLVCKTQSGSHKMIYSKKGLTTCLITLVMPACYQFSLLRFGHSLFTVIFLLSFLIMARMGIMIQYVKDV